MPVETTKPEKAPSTGANGSASVPWEGFMETIGKYGRNAERHLYVYGISVSRCACCRQRLKEDARNCEQCGQEVPTKSQACTRCKTPKPGIWCYECDSYYCEPCHRKPHGLRFGNDKQAPHHCYAIDGSSGKLLRCGSFSDTLKAMAKAARRSQMKLSQDKDKPAAARQPSTTEAKPTTDVTAQASTALRTERLRAEEKAAREKKLTAKETAPMMQQNPVARPAQPAPVATAPAGPVDLATLSSSIAAMRESRKRKAPTVDLTEMSPEASTPAHQQQPQVVPHGAAAAAAASQAEQSAIDGKSLYDRLKHRFSAGPGPAPAPDRRIKSEIGAAVAAAAATALASRPPLATPTSRPTASFAAPIVTPSPTATNPAGRIVTMSTPPPHPMTAASRPMSLNHGLQPQPGSFLPPQHQQQLSSSNSFGFQPPSATHSSSLMATGLSSASLSSDALSADPLKGAVVEVYDHVNKQMSVIEQKLTTLSDMVRRASEQNVAHAAQISARMVQYRNELLTAEEERVQALAKVILFSNDMRSFAMSLQPHQLGDIPHVLKGCHVKCAHLAKNIEELKAKQKTLRDTIEAAANSGDVTQLLRLQSFSAEIEAIDEQIQQTRKDRDGQFQLMFQFSKRLRDAVRAQYAAVRTPSQTPTA